MTNKNIAPAPVAPALHGIPGLIAEVDGVTRMGIFATAAADLGDVIAAPFAVGCDECGATRGSRNLAAAHRLADKGCPDCADC